MTRDRHTAPGHRPNTPPARPPAQPPRATLADLQHHLQQHLLQGDAAIAEHLVPGGIGIARRLHIYHHAYRARLVDALRDTFGHTATYLGDDWFERDAARYVELSPSRRPNLNDYGEGLPAWWAQHYPNDPDIAELATLDWTLRRAFDGPDAPLLALADLATVAPDAWARIGFTLNPTVRLLHFSRNTLALWSALDRGETPPPAVAQAADVLVWRQAQQPHFRSLGALESLALARLQSGLGFAAMCGDLALQFQQADVPVEAGTLLRRWVEEGVLSAINDPAG